jgi:hypothetical protein
MSEGTAHFFVEAKSAVCAGRAFSVSAPQDASVKQTITSKADHAGEQSARP